MLLYTENSQSDRNYRFQKVHCLCNKLQDLILGDKLFTILHSFSAVFEEFKSSGIFILLAEYA